MAALAIANGQLKQRPRGHFCAPITPQTASILHADRQCAKGQNQPGAFALLWADRAEDRADFVR
jgi:hypothetical protein